MLREYLMLYNYDTDEYGMEVLDAIKSMFPSAKVENYSICRPDGEPILIHNEKAVSVWIPTEQFLSAWMFVNMYISESDKKLSQECVEDFLIEETIDDGIRYLNKRIEDTLFIRYY